MLVGVCVVCEGASERIKLDGRTILIRTSRGRARFRQLYYYSASAFGGETTLLYCKYCHVTKSLRTVTPSSIVVFHVECLSLGTLFCALDSRIPNSLRTQWRDRESDVARVYSRVAI